MKPRKKYYMHTMDGMPAFYLPGKTLYFTGRASTHNRLATSLKQIRREQKAAREFDIKLGRPANDFIYDYILVYPPTHNRRKHK